MPETLPTEADFIKVEYTDEHGNEKSVKGEVTEVDEDPETEANDLFVRADEAGSANQEVHYFEYTGEEGEDVRSVHRYSPFGGTYHLGDDAELEVLG